MEKEAKTCERCGGELIQGELVTGHGMAFYAKGEKMKLLPKKISPVICWCCKNCGLIQNIVATEPERLA